MYRGEVAIAIVTDYGNLLGRGDVEARLKLRGLDQIKYLFEFISWYVGYESSAHYFSRLNWSVKSPGH